MIQSQSETLPLFTALELWGEGGEGDSRFRPDSPPEKRANTTCIEDSFFPAMRVCVSSREWSARDGGGARLDWEWPGLVCDGVLLDPWTSLGLSIQASVEFTNSIISPRL